MNLPEDFPWQIVDTESLSVVPDTDQCVLYLLGFAAGQLSPLSDNYPQLLKQLRIECLPIGNISAWYKLIDQREFVGDVGSQNLADLNWLTPRVLAHEAVVARLCQYFTFYPSRFGSLFSSAERLSAFTQSHQRLLNDYFCHVAGRQEWGIKFVADIDQATLQLTEETLNAEGSTGTGSNYLRFKHLQRTLRPAATQRLQLSCQTAVEELKGKYELVLRPRPSATTPDRESQLANAALLISQEASTELVDWCQRWNDRKNVGVSVEARLTGPWPPYSFCPSLAEQTPQRQAA